MVLPSKINDPSSCFAGRSFIFIKFIFDIPDHFFHDIFQGNNTAGAAEFIHHNGKMNTVCLEIPAKGL